MPLSITCLNAQMDAKRRPSAKELLRHRFIRAARKSATLMPLVSRYDHERKKRSVDTSSAHNNRRTKPAYSAPAILAPDGSWDFGPSPDPGWDFTAAATSGAPPLMAAAAAASCSLAGAPGSPTAEQSDTASLARDARDDGCESMQHLSLSVPGQTLLQQHLQQSMACPSSSTASQHAQLPAPEESQQSRYRQMQKPQLQYPSTRCGHEHTG